jgi:hypothetical protein
MGQCTGGQETNLRFTAPQFRKMLKPVNYGILILVILYSDSEGKDARHRSKNEDLFYATLFRK